MKRFLSLALALALLVSCTAIVGASAEAISITIPHYKTGENVGAVYFLGLVDRFNKANEGRYHVAIEELTQDMYATKIQQLAIQNKLPILIEGGDADWMESVIVKNHMYYDLSGFFKDHPEILALASEGDIAFNTKEDGTVVSAANFVVRPMGLFYNQEMLNLEKTPGEYATWDEFLSAMGENKFALMTAENGWTTLLIYTALIAAEEGGPEFIAEHYDNPITDFNVPILVAATEKLKTLFLQYGTDSAVGSAYADAANAFMSKHAAVIANGSWMVGDFAADAADKWSNDFDGAAVHGGVFPGNIAVLPSTSANYGWWIANSATDAEKECACAFLAFMFSKDELEEFMLAEGGTVPKLPEDPEFEARRAAENPLLGEYVSAVNTDTTLVPQFLWCMPDSLGDGQFFAMIPKLIDGTYTTEEFLNEITRVGREALED